MLELLTIIGYSRRTLTDRELAAWERRRRHPILWALGFIAATVVLADLLVYGIVLIARSQGSKIPAREVPDYLILATICGFVVGVVVFLWWYVNGVVLYKKQRGSWG